MSLLLRRLFLAVLLGSSVGLLGASGPPLPTAVAPLPTSVTKALESKNREAAAVQLERAAVHADSVDTPWNLLYAAELRRLTGEPELARAHFSEVVTRYSSSIARDPALLGLAVIDAAGAPGGNVLATLGLIADTGVPDTLNAERYLLLAQVKRASGASRSEVLRLTRRASAYAPVDSEISARVAAFLGAAPATEALSTEPADLVAIRAVRAAVLTGRFEAVPELAAPFTTALVDSPFAREAAFALQRAEKGTRVDPALVAVLLPLTGAYALPGESLRAAIELGNVKAGNSLRLVFLDTTGSPEKSVEALKLATLEQGAGLVLGPLLREEALACAPVAQAIHVPLVTLTSSEEVLAAGDQVYRAFPSTEQLIGALLAETYDVRGLHRYAILSPTTPFGENAARVFADAVAGRGGAIAARVTYAIDQKDFRSTAKILGNKDYKARANEFYTIQQAAKRAGGDPAKSVLPPLIDYDAIFIPDSYQRVALLASALAFEEFPVGRFRPHKEDKPVILLGLNAWNNEELVRRGGTYVQDSIFVDAFDPRAATADDFRLAWKEHGKGDATVVEAVAYDTTRLLAAAVQAGGDPIAALQAARLEDPVAGTRSFGADRQVARDWRLLTVTREGIRPLAPPEPVVPLETPGE